MRAVRLTDARRLELVEVPDPEPSPGEVVVRVAACGICGSDLSCYKTGVFVGSVLGHEIGGVVESVGPGAGPWRAGDPVAVDPKIPCGECVDCVSGNTQRCVVSLGKGIGGGRLGAFAERVLVPAASLHRLPGGVPVEDACLVEPLAVALHGLARAGSEPGESALVIGLGPIGLLTVAALRARGAHGTVGVDPVEARRSFALSLGAARALASMEEARAAGVTASLVAECSGRPEMIQEAANVTAPGGRVLLLGVPMTKASVTPMVWVTREISVVGSVSSAGEDFAHAIALLASHPEIAGIITSRVPLGDVPAAFERLLSPTTDGKVAVDPRLP